MKDRTSGRVLEVPLPCGRSALVDAEDESLIRGYRWASHEGSRATTRYVRASVRSADGKWTYVLMHRLILAVGPGVVVDHVNHDGLDNRRANLRVCSLTQNNGNRRLNRNNRSGFKGVYRDTRPGKWRAVLRVNGRARTLGRYASPEEAAKAYDEAAIAHFGEFALTNSVMRDRAFTGQ